LGDNSGESLAFARGVRISGWTSVGDKLGGAYIGTSYLMSLNSRNLMQCPCDILYNCVIIKTKEGTTIHAHKRYSAFDALRSSLERYLLHHQRASILPLPPKSPLARFRPPFSRKEDEDCNFGLRASCILKSVDASQ
ncbi:hypothetical protein FIBSPDRAFT_1025824, partial [Athelia psychrophila]